MATETPLKPVEDTIAKVDDELAVGEDLQFQRRWWKFEKISWSFLALFVLLDAAGFFGRGPLSKSHKHTADGAMRMEYEWVQRYGTPSIVMLHFRPAAVHNGAIQVWVSDSLVNELGNQRIIPQPAISVSGDSGVAYTVPASSEPNSMAFALQPTKIGLHHFIVRVLGSGTVNHPQETLEADVFVMP